MIQYTPGPWQWTLSADEDGDAVINIHALSGDMEVSIIEGAYFVCESDEENDANTELICAAPDLYEALVDLEGFARALQDSATISTLKAAALRDHLRVARAAIAKARGEYDEDTA